MIVISYICIGLSVVSLILVIKAIRNKEKKMILRYHGITKKK